MPVPCRPLLRRAVTVICAVALLWVGLAHSFQHFNAVQPAIALAQVDTDSADNLPDSADKAAAAVEHCHGCTMTAVPLLGQSIVLVRVAADHPPGKPDDARQHIPIAETPPPILTI